MNNCVISQQIAIYCQANEVECYTEEALQQLIRIDFTTINGESYQMFEITDMLDVEELKEAAQAVVTGEAINALNQLYLDKIKDIING